MFKSNFHTEPYVHYVKGFKLRSLIQLCLSSHKLAIEKGRHCKQKIVVDNHYMFSVVGMMWKMNYIFYLSAHFTLMHTYSFYPRFYLKKGGFCFINTQSVKDSFTKFMSTDNENILFCLAKSINKCLKK